MKGQPSVIDHLKRQLTGELTAADQYFIHARMLQNWGFHELYERIEHERQDELDHAGRLINRILFLEGAPDVAARNALRVGTDVPSILRNDLAVEIETIESLKQGIAVCEREQDYETRHILRELLADTEEDHTHWLEQQLFLIDQLGLQNYLQSAMGGIKSVS